MPTLLCASMKNVLTSSCKVASYYKSQLSSDAQCVVEFDRSLMENVICVRSDVNSEPILRLPRDNRPLSALNIKHSFVVLQIQLADLEHFAIHLWLRQSAMQSVKLILSTSVKAAQRERLVDGTVQLKLPLIVPRKRWIQIIFHLPGILEHLFKESPVIAIDAVHIAGHARLRSLMTSDDEQSCIDSTPPGFALFAVPAYTAPVWITAHSATASRGNNYSTNNNNNLSHATPSASANTTMEKECFMDKDKCLADSTHNDSLHVNFSEQLTNERYDKTNSIEKGNNVHSSNKPTCNKKADKSEPLSMTVECKKHNEEASSSSPSMLSSLSPSCLPPLKRANNNEQMTPKKQSSLTHTDKTYSSFEELHLSEETNTLSPLNSSKSESITESRQWQSNECTHSESGAGCEENNTTRSTLIKLEPIPPSSSSSSTSVTSAENYSRDKNVTSTNANIIKSSVPSSSKASSYDNNKDHLETRATTQPVIDRKNTHTSLPHNSKRKNNDTYIKLLDCTKLCNCNVKENINVNTSNNGNNRSVSGDVDRRKRTKDKEVNANKEDCICAWHASLQRSYNINEEKAEQQPLQATSNNSKNEKSNKNNRGKDDDDIASANKLSNESTSVGKTRTKSTKETCTAIIEEQPHKFITVCNEREETLSIFTSDTTATVAATNTVNINNNNHTSIVDNVRWQANNVLVISNTGWKHNVDSDTCKSSVTTEQPLEVSATLYRPQEQSHEPNKESKRQQKHRCIYDNERRCEEKEQLRKKKMTRLGRQLKLLRVNAKRRQQEYVHTVNCDGRASNIPVSQMLRELREHETHSRQIKLIYRNNEAEDDCNVYMYGFGVGYLGVLSENGEYQLDNSFEDNDSNTYSKDLLQSDLHLVSKYDNCNE